MMIARPSWRCDHHPRRLRGADAVDHGLRGEAVQVRQRYARHFLNRTVQYEKEPFAPHFHLERANLLSAVGYALDEGDFETVAEIFRNIATLWAVQPNYLAEGLIARALAAPLTPSQRSAVLQAKFALDFRRGKFNGHEAEELLSLSRHTRGEMWALLTLGALSYASDPAAGITLYREALVTSRAQGDHFGWVGAAQILALMLLASSCDPTESQALVEESASLLAQGDEQLVHAWMLRAWNRYAQGALHLAAGRLDNAHAAFVAALKLAAQLSDAAATAACLESLAAHAYAVGDLSRAAALWEAVSAYRLVAQVFPFAETQVLAPLLDQLRARLDSPALKDARAQGERWTVEEAVEFALSGAPLSAVVQAPRTDLTPRERDVLMALSQGLSNKEIARELDISLYTVNDHVKTIYSKLGVSSRAAATRYALEQLS